MLYVAPSGSNDANASYVGKDVAAGKQGSKVPPSAVEHPQRELLAVIAAGQTMGLAAPTATDLTQVLKTVRSGLLNRFPAAGTPDAITITPQPACAALIEGMRFRIKIPGAANVSNATRGPTLTVNGITVSLKTRSGSNPAVGDFVGGNVVEVEIWADGTARVQNALPGDDTSQAVITTTVAGAVQGLKTIPYSNFVPGSYTVTVPAGVSAAEVQIWGGGGGGGGCGSANNGSASGGGGGGYSRKFMTGLIPGQQFALAIGAGGAAGGTGGAGGNGGTTSFGSICSATGGIGGSPNTVGSGGVYGSGTGGDVNLLGGYGNAGLNSGYGAGGAGGSAAFGGTGGGGAPGIASGGCVPGGGGGGSGSAAVNIGTPGAPGGCLILWK